VSKVYHEGQALAALRCIITHPGITSSHKKIEGLESPTNAYFCTLSEVFEEPTLEAVLSYQYWNYFSDAILVKDHIHTARCLLQKK